MNKQIYLDYVKAAVIEGRKQYEAAIEGWRESYKPDKFLGMYSPPGNLGLQAQTEAFLYRITGEEEYGRWAKRALLDIEAFKEIVPDSIRRRHPEYERGITSFEPMFQGTHYLQGYLAMKDSALLSAEEKRQIEGSIRSAMQAVLHYPEWGAHNRSMLRVFNLSMAVKALGDTGETREWAKLRDYLAEESFGGWSIEDAELYLPLWLGSTIMYAQLTEREDEYFAKPQTKYYFDFIARLIAPNGQIPDFGDANFNSFWYLWLACLEKGAARYGCGHMKYAAGRIYEYAMALQQGPPSIYLAAYFANAYDWCDETVAPKRPDGKSELLLDDLVGKKIAFRSGWDEDASYLLLNYRDEGGYAAVPREYLRRTILAPAEKAHHGHADENAVCYLVQEQNVLLHDGGYRDGAPNGRYRADIYHNRLVFRYGAPEGPLYDFIHDDGSYKQAKTEKLHFHTFAELDYSRTRMIDPLRAVVWDRCVTYLKQEGVYILVDWTVSQSEGLLTTANLWHPSSVLEAGDRHFVGQVRQIYQQPDDPRPIENRKELALLIEFPESGRTIGREKIRRCYADSDMVYETDTRAVEAGTMNVFVTVLTPVPAGGGSPLPLGRVSIVGQPQDNGRLGLRFASGSREIELCYKLDLDAGLLATAAIPKYGWDASRLAYGAVTTDADFAFVCRGGGEAGRYGFVNGCGLELDGASLFRTP
ncbi:hypothetical protein [Paenibacillus sacheonensis]|uniref:Uncharacterized protein n=1 Tax=Paenibacillus sacheonensis TaxID=742054 RepID=A0A7X4YP78_9BACL|nr:hypothetical protein [Paenibacillus sacheonensis]MBM7565291.1 hypothetical protein [Paenibacillus sacheonensis]NBC69938.1 hypothetical protein [Paenibacillus sacheonensis]